MDYKRNYLYFKNPRKFNFLWFLFFLIVAGGIGYATYSGLMPLTMLGYILAGIFVLIGIAFGAIFPLRVHIKDAYIDKQVKDAVTMFEKLALQQLHITPVNRDDLNTVRYYDFVETSKYQDIEILTRLGADDKKRTSQCRLVSYFFAENRFITYHYEFSLIRPWLAEGYTNYYYSEISSKEVHEVNTEDNPYLQMVSIVNK